MNQTEIILQFYFMMVSGGVIAGLIWSLFFHFTEI